MDKRKATMYASPPRSGTGTKFRITLPPTWVRAMGLSEENKSVELGFDGDKIIISKKEAD